MSEVTINNSPVHSQAKISYPYGVQDSGYSCGWHTGVDIIPSGDTERNPILYSPVEGRVVYTNNSSNVALGVQVQILDNNGIYWRFCHMVLNSLQVSVGDTVDTSTPLGRMGETGNVTGIHLHLETSLSQAWQCSTFVNPCNLLNIPNEDDLIIKYDGSIPPIPPRPSIHSNFKKWLEVKSKRINITY